MANLHGALLVPHSRREFNNGFSLRELTGISIPMAFEGIQDPAARRIAERLISAGYAAYVAGGAARDMVMGRRPGDYDIATSASFEEVRDLFADMGVRETGRTFRVALVRGVEISPFRSKSSFGLDADPQAVGTSIHEDLSLRDLTVNSMAVDANSGELIDPYGGASDLADRVIRFTGDPAERLAEDPCRAVRACRFMALLSGRFSPPTLAALKIHAPGSVMRTAAERLRLEILKAMRIRRASVFFRGLLDVGILPLIFPSLADTAGHPGGPNHADDVFTHSMLTGDKIPTRCTLLKLAAYLHDSGKPKAAEVIDGRLKFIGHEKHGAKTLKAELERLHFSRREQRTILAVIRHHMHDFTPRSTPRATRRLLARLAEAGVAYRNFLHLRVADHGSNRAKSPYSFAQIRAMLARIDQEAFPEAQGPAYTVSDLKIGGFEVMRELGLDAGPEVGVALRELLKQVVEDPALNDKDTLVRMLREM